MYTLSQMVATTLETIVICLSLWLSDKLATSKRQPVATILETNLKATLPNKHIFGDTKSKQLFGVFFCLFKGPNTLQFSGLVSRTLLPPSLVYFCRPELDFMTRAVMKRFRASLCVDFSSVFCEHKTYKFSLKC
jgi:hypothetical protein